MTSDGDYNGEDGGYEGHEGYEGWNQGHEGYEFAPPLPASAEAIDTEREIPWPAINEASGYVEMSSTQFNVLVVGILVLIIINIFCLAMTHGKACLRQKHKHLKMVRVLGLDSKDDNDDANEKEKANLLIKQYHIP
eukprot:118434_1